MSSSRVFSGCRALMAAASKGSSGIAGAAVSSTTTTTTATGRVSGIAKLSPVSPALSKFLGGVPEASRTGTVKKVWEYIKANNLQNPNNKKEICCDEKLKTIFEGKDTVDFLKISGLLNRHFVKAK